VYYPACNRVFRNTPFLGETYAGTLIPQRTLMFKTYNTIQYRSGITPMKFVVVKVQVNNREIHVHDIATFVFARGIVHKQL